MRTNRQSAQNQSIVFTLKLVPVSIIMPDLDTIKHCKITYILSLSVETFSYWRHRKVLAKENVRKMIKVSKLLFIILTRQKKKKLHILIGFH